MSRSLVAWINQTPVGILREARGIWEFEYASDWLDASTSHALSPSLPLQKNALRDDSSSRQVQWYFDNLLPEEGQRTLLAHDARIDQADAFGLLAYYGAESAGSLTLLPPGTVPTPDVASRPLEDAALEERIRQLPRVPLMHGAVKRMSLAGAQHKLPVILRGDHILEPVGASVSTHILKPDHPDPDYSASAINEFFTMRLAAEAGLNVPRVHLRHVPSTVYLVERFDRIQHDGIWARRHVIDACQLLGLDKSFKYSQGSLDTLGQLANACRSPALARNQLFRWIVFNVLLGNGDAHLKNISFLVSHEGIDIAPFYDLVSTAAYETRAFEKNGWPDTTTLAWPLEDARFFSDLNMEVLLRAASGLNIQASAARRIATALRDAVVQRTPALIARIEEERRAMPAWPNAAGELRCLQVIEKIIVRDMAARLA